MTTKKLYTVIIFSENIVGLLNQITIIFTRRQPVSYTHLTLPTIA